MGNFKEITIDPASKKRLPNKKRQWGTEKNFTPLPALHENPSTFKLAMGKLAIVVTIFFWLCYIFSIIIRQFLDGTQGYNFTMQAFGYALVMSLLTLSSLIYLITRNGALQRFSKHVRVPRALLDEHFAKNKSGITVLVPALREEYSVIRKTLLSAALQEYPNLRIVLAVDDKPNPADPEEAAKQAKTMGIGQDIKEFLSEPFNRFNTAMKKFELGAPSSKLISVSETVKLADQYEWAANWLRQKADQETMEDHVDVFFADQVFRELASDFGLLAEALRMSAKEGSSVTRERALQLYRRLVWTFQVKIETFQRKKYSNVSHELNKAMNLNVYIGLMGGNYKTQTSPDGTMLLPTEEKGPGIIEVPDSEFLLTLDADSILLREYCLRLVYFLQQPDNQEVAVTQTPYSSFRGAFSRIERLAGATTDIQHMLHQGLSYYGATFWVGANAVIRKKALLDIEEREWVAGVEIKRYIQDRTVIEDTESSIDLAKHGWKLVNYPERLSYSATPPDFGSLVIQRRRWANGGLLMVGKLWAQIRGRARGEPMSRMEFLLRLNYIASIAWATFGLMFLLAYPYDGRLLSPLVLLAAVPYFLAMGSDLKYSGYNYSDIFRIYGFNLIMLPVNLAGVLKSVEQALTGKKIPFARTPKINNRTVAAPIYLIAPLLIVGFSIFTVYRNVLVENWGNAAFAGFNALVATWAIVAYIGIGNLIADLWVGFVDFIYVENKTKPKHKKVENESKVDWRLVIYNGDKQGSIPKLSLYN